MPGNSVTNYQNGEQFFPTILGDIRADRYSINLKIYILRPSQVGEKLIAALAERQHEGVRVQVMADWIGSRTDERVPAKLRAAGIKFTWFRSPRLGTIDQLNNRPHRKTLILDGRVAYAGGTGIDDGWRGDGRRDDQHRAKMVQVEEPAVARMRAVFF